VGVPRDERARDRAGGDPARPGGAQLQVAAVVEIPGDQGSVERVIRLHAPDIDDAGAGELKVDLP